jgi:O-antigen/teichoic acid export membrane protein
LKIRIKNIDFFSLFNIHFLNNEVGTSKERYRRILLSGGSALIVKFFSIIINFIIIPLTVNFLGQERYGLWMAITSVLALMSFSDLGLGNGLLNAISNANARKNIDDARIAVSSTFFLLLLISFIILIFFILVYSFIPWYKIFNVKSQIAIIESGPTFIVLIILFLINLPLGIIQRIEEGYQEGYQFQFWLFIGSILSFIGVSICIFLKSSLPWLVFSFSGGQLISSFMNGYFLFYKRKLYLKPSLKLFNYSIGKKLINTGFIFFILGILTLFANALDDIIISHVINISSVSEFEIVKKIFLFTMLTSFFIQPLWPAFGEAIESGDHIWARKAFKNILLFSIIFTSITALPLVIFGKQIISFWIGKEFMPSWTLLFGFYIYIILNNYIGIVSTVINSSSYVKQLILPIFLTMIFSVLLKIYFANIFGISGIIWSSIISWGIFFVTPSYLIVKNILNK